MRSIIGRIKSLVASAAVALALLVPLGEPVRSADYEELVAQARQAKAEFDYAALRNAYADSKSYDGYNTDLISLRGPFRKAFADGDCASAIRHGQEILEKNYVFLDAHQILGVCYGRLGQTDLAERHTAAARGLYRSIHATGDGKTPETAFVVISVAEEYSVLGIQGLKRGQQVLIKKDGHSFDLLTVENKSGGKEQLYFNIDRVLRWSAEKLKPAK
jgi:hypothetical protein